MKLRVETSNGDTQTLEIHAPLSSREGPKLNRLVGADGMEYFFTKEGYYDGWGLPGKHP